MLWEIDDELERRNEAGPDLVVVQVGVGAFAAAVARHFRRPELRHSKLMSVEPRARIACSSRWRRDASCPCLGRTIPSCLV